MMKVKPLKIKIKEPTPSAADRLYAQQQKNRKAAGLPDPSEYKKKLDSMKSEEVEQLDEIGNTPAGRKALGNYINRSHESGDAARIMTAYDKDNFAKHAKTVAKRSSGIAKAVTRLTREELEQLDELSPETKASYVSKAKEQIKQSIPYTKKGEEYRDIAKNFIEKRKKGIAKVTEQHVEGRFKPVKPRNVKSVGTASPRQTSDSSDVRLKESIKLGGTGGRGNIYQYDRNPPPKDGSELENTPSHPKTELQKRLKTALTDLGNKMKEKYPHLREGTQDEVKADQITTDNQKFPKKMSRKAQIVKDAAKGKPDQFQANPILDSDVNPQTNKQ